MRAIFVTSLYYFHVLCCILSIRLEFSTRKSELGFRVCCWAILNRISFNGGSFWYQLSPSQVLFMLRRISVIDIMKVWVHPECMGWIYFTSWKELRCWNLENNCWWSVVTFFFLIFVQKACVQYGVVISPNILLVNLTNKKQQKV